MKKQRNIILFSILSLLIVSLLFFSLKFIFPSGNQQLFNEFFILGTNCWAMILGLLCLLKSRHDIGDYAKCLIALK